MTNEEAIRTLRNAAWLIVGSFSSMADSVAGEKIEKAVDMAVKALKAQEQLANNSPELDNNFGELISRVVVAQQSRIGRMEMRRLDKAIADVAYILDTLMAYRNIVESGSCNDCRMAKPYSCEHLPKPGQLVRYNCPFYEREEDTDVNVKS